MVTGKLEDSNLGGQFGVEILNKDHDRKRFQSGNESLDKYLKQFANQDVKRDLAVVYVMVAKNEPQIILGFYTLSNDSIEFESLPEEAKGLNKKLPRSRRIPVTLLGQLAVDQSLQGKGVGRELLGEAIKVAIETSQKIASHALVADALDEEVEKFYTRAGFSKLKHYERRLFLRLKSS